MATTAEYWVLNNNWTKEILSQGTYNPEAKVPTINYLINVDATTNPALGCDKGFEATYQCGKYTNAAKQISIAPEALGKTASFDCTAESALCTGLKLTLDDDGSLTLFNTKNGNILWTSDEIAGSKITPDSVKALDKYKAANGKYPRNYLEPGETLDMSGNEWIGSPSGKYRLMMSNNGLQVVYSTDGCGDLMTVGSSAFDTTKATLLYEMPRSYPQFIGQMGYINDAGQLQVFDPVNQLFTSSYEKIGNYNMLDANIGTEFAGSNESKCEIQCNKDNTCAGFVYDAERKRCQLKNADVYKTKRIMNNNFQYYLRNKKANNDTSCPQDITNEDSGFWGNAVMSPDPMLSTTACGLKRYTKDERLAAAEQETKVMDTVTSEFKTLMDTLRNKYTLLKSHILSTGADMETAKGDLLAIEAAGMDNLKNAQYAQLKAMSEDTDLNMMSQNYRHILWSILAIVIIIATMKIAK
jgi:hypothetical protein